ncbi:UNVERIFIED_CONTAM: hypothetical protein FKN15_023100 [Acipenser sinensis]
MKSGKAGKRCGRGATACVWNMDRRDSADVVQGTWKMVAAHPINADIELGMSCKGLWESWRSRGSGTPRAKQKQKQGKAKHRIPKGQGGVLDAQASCTQGVPVLLGYVSLAGPCGLSTVRTKHRAHQALCTPSTVSTTCTKALYAPRHRSTVLTACTEHCAHRALCAPRHRRTKS